MMAETLMVYEPGDRLCTMSATGRALVWQTQANGLLKIVEGRWPADDLDPEDNYDLETDDDHD